MAIPALNAAGPGGLAAPPAGHRVASAPQAPAATRGASWTWVWRWLWAWPFPLAVLALWQLSAVGGWVPEQVLPPPAAVFKVFAELLASGELWDHLTISMVRVAGGFGIGLVLGLLLGGAMGLSPTFRDYVFPLFKAFSQVPVIGWLPLLILLVGIDEGLKFLLIAKAALVPVAINTCQGIENVPNRLVEVARVYGYTRWQMLRKVVFPAATAPILERGALWPHPRLAGVGGGGAARVLRGHRFSDRLWPPALSAGRGAGRCGGRGHRRLFYRQAAGRDRGLAAALAQAGAVRGVPMSSNNVFQRVPRHLRGWVLPAAILLVWWAAVAGGWSTSPLLVSPAGRVAARSDPGGQWRAVGGLVGQPVAHGLGLL